jgi:hypothetical protein
MLFNFLRRNYIHACQFLSCHVLMQELDDNVYQEVVKHLFKEAKP